MDVNYLFQNAKKFQDELLEIRTSNAKLKMSADVRVFVWAVFCILRTLPSLSLRSPKLASS